MSHEGHRTSSIGNWRDDARWLLTAAILACLAALLGLRLQTDGIALFWPAAGVAAGLMAISQARARAFVALGVLLALTIANLSQGRSLATATMLMAGNLTQALLIALAAERLIGWPVRLDSVRKVAMFLVIAIITPAVVGLAAAGGLRWTAHTNPTFVDAWWIWASSHGVGLVGVMPAVLLLRGLRWDALRGQTDDAALVLAVATAAVAGLRALFPETSVLMLLTLVLLGPLAWWVALRANVARAAIALLIISVVTIWTASGDGLFSDVAWAGQAFLIGVAAMLLVLGAWGSQRPGSDARRLTEIGDVRALVLLVPLMLFAAYAW